MIQKVVKGRGFRGVLVYLTSQDRGKLIASNMAGENPRELAREFATVRRMRPALGKAVAHISISLSPEDRNLTDEEFSAVATTYLEHMGFNDCPFVAIRHNDTQHQHIHIVASRIKTNGEVVSDSQDYKRGEQILRILEKNLELIQIQPSVMAKHKSPTRKELQLINQGEKTMKQEIRSLIDEAIESSINRWHYEGLKEPHIVVKNRDNDKAHLFWRIDGFVCHDGNTPPKLLSLWNDCKAGLNYTLDGDPHFSDGFTKNPLSGDFIIQTRHDPSPYRLGDFVSDLAFPNRKTRHQARSMGNQFASLSQIIEGARNDTLFHAMRFYAYNNKWRFVGQGRQAFHNEIAFMSLQSNSLFPDPLPNQEVLQTIVKSIVKWVWDKNPDKWLVCPDNKNRGVCHTLGLIQPSMSLNQRQSVGADYTNDLRRQQSMEAITRAVMQLKTSGQRVSVSEVAKMAGMTRDTIYKYYRDLVLV